MFYWVDWMSLVLGVGVVMGKGTGQIPVGISLGEQKPTFPFQLLNSIGTGCPAQRWLVLAHELDQRRGEFGRIASL